MENMGLLLKGAEVAEKAELLNTHFASVFTDVARSQKFLAQETREKVWRKVDPPPEISFGVIVWDSFLLLVYFQACTITVPSGCSICSFGSRSSCISVIFLIATYPVIFNYLCKVKLYHLIFLKDGMREAHGQPFCMPKETI